ncbi:alpha/beta hydrolase [Actinoplanes sp. NPDC049316]|uniref:alpha/beta hydrolase n=1 Tax=Actinoplanes sp. NPDC049316 TaxID=3154727 RepID=UPI0034161E5A
MSAVADPLHPEEFDVPVAGGALRVCRWPGTGPVVLAAHGITANALAFAGLAEALDGRVRLVAPDLRGRAGSSGLPGPYGMAAHAADLIAVADHLGLDRVPLAGHSMGGFAVAATAAAYPDRVSAALLIDGGVALPVPDTVDVDEVLTAVIGPAMRRLSMTFAGPEDYLAFFREHPALGPYWTPAVEAYVLRDLTGTPPELRSSCALAAVRADASDTLITRDTVTAVHRLGCPARLMWAPRGLLDEDQGLYDPDRLAAAALDPARIAVERVPGVNHYTILFDPDGVQRVAERVLELVTT